MIEGNSVGVTDGTRVGEIKWPGDGAIVGTAVGDPNISGVQVGASVGAKPMQHIGYNIVHQMLLKTNVL